MSNPIPHLTLTRAPATTAGIFGILQDAMNKTAYTTLERVYMSDGLTPAPLIPVGTWTATRFKSPKFGYEVFQLQGVPGHTALELHIANWQTELSGCIALGEIIRGGMLHNSTQAFLAFMDAYTDINTLTIEVLP